MADSTTKLTKAEKKAQKYATQQQNLYNNYQNSGHYQATGITQLQENLANYTHDDDYYRNRATAQYDPTYQAERLANQQATQATVQGYQNQLNMANLRYGQQVQDTASSYAKNLSTMLNNLTKRGLGRSSLVGTGTIANQNAYQAAAQRIYDTWNTEAGGIESNMALTTQQGAEKLAQLDSSYAQQIESRMMELQAADRDAATNLQLQIEQLQYQGYIDWLGSKQGKKAKKAASKTPTNGSTPTTTNPTANPTTTTTNPGGQVRQPKPT